MVKIEVDAVDALGNLTKALRNQILRKAIRAAAGPVRQRARTEAPERTGALKKALATKLQTKALSVLGIIGPRKDYETEYKGKKVRPVRYAHLVPKDDPKNYMRDAVKPEEAKTLMADKIAEEIRKVVQ